jgi:hypothetical protein
MKGVAVKNARTLFICLPKNKKSFAKELIKEKIFSTSQKQDWHH